MSFSDPYGLQACPGVEGTDQESIDDCPEGSPEYYAAKIAKGQGNAAVNTTLGVVATMGQVLAEHTALSGTVGYNTVSADAYALTAALTGTSDQTTVVTNYTGMIGALPQVGASADVVLGDPSRGPKDFSMVYGLRHLGVTVTWTDQNRPPGSPRLKSVTISAGISTPNLPSGAAFGYTERH